MQPRTTLILLFCTLLTSSLWAQTASGAGELTGASLLLSANHLQVTEFGGGVPANTGADYYSIEYTTPNIEGVIDTASGLLVVPRRGDIDMAMTLYQRSTPISGATAPSSLTAEDAVFAASALAGQGMIILCPDYLGMGRSPGFHPYLDKETEAAVAIDMLYAVEQFLEQEDIGWNGQLFVTGYSQGGHAAMATHQELQANYQDDWPVTRSAPMAGAYNLPLVESLVLDTDAEFFFLSLVPYIVIGMQEAEGDIYASLDEVFKEPYLDICSQFLSPGWETGAVDLNAIAGQLANAMFPLEGGLYPARMLQYDYRQAMATDENHPLRVALRENSPLDWSPEVPMLLPYCADDDVVDAEHTLTAAAILSATGADVSTVNSGPALDHIQCFGPSLFTTLGFFDAVRTDRGQIVPGGFVQDDSLRTHLTYLPPGYDGTEELPLVFILHGLGLNSEFRIFASRMGPVADTANFIAVYPQALSTTPYGPTWNDRLDPSAPDDVAYFNSLIDTLMTNYAIDSSRVYFSGFSQGGAMSHLLSCQLSDRVAAVASVAGTIFTPLYENSCDGTPPVPLLHMHGTDDPVVPYTGGEEAFPGFITPDVDDYLAFWAELYGCDTEPQAEQVPNINLQDSSTVEIRRYGNCDPESELLLYVIENGSHVWPGGPAVPPEFVDLAGTIVNQDIHASVEIWNFFNRHQLGELVNAEMLSPADLELRVFPNPFSQQLNLTFSLPAATTVQLRIFNQLGQEIETFAPQLLGKGPQQLQWQPSSRRLPPGLYYCRLQIGEQMISRSIVLTK